MNYYDILEVKEDASFEVITMAYKALCKKFHPDVCPQEFKYQATEIMKNLNIAYEVLSDPRKRSLYDYELKRMRESNKNEYNPSSNSTENTTYKEQPSYNEDEPTNDDALILELKNTKKVRNFLAVLTILLLIFTTISGYSLYESDLTIESLKKDNEFYSELCNELDNMNDFYHDVCRQYNVPIDILWFEEQKNN